jgi:hypothetical protein
MGILSKKRRCSGWVGAAAFIEPPVRGQNALEAGLGHKDNVTGSLSKGGVTIYVSL